MALFLNEHRLNKVIRLLEKAQPFTSYDEVFDILKGKTNKKHVISFLNMYAVQNSLESEDFFSALINSDLLLFDGIAMRLLCKVLGIRYGKNMNGSDYIPALIKEYSHKKFMVFASDNQALSMFSEKHSHLQVICKLDGFQHFDTYYEAAKKHEADVVLLGMGMPKQEIISSQLQGKFLVINGGAIVDYLAGYKKRAPFLFIKLHLEWLYRIGYEPKRLFKRYATGFVIALQITATYLTKNKVAVS